MISLAFLTTWGQSGASGCRTINHWQLGARKPYGARLFGVFALVQIGFKFPFGERRIGEFGRKARDAPIGALVPYASNSRTHTPEQKISNIARNVEAFGHAPARGGIEETAARAAKAGVRAGQPRI
jgi:hypothetical protein